MGFGAVADLVVQFTAFGSQIVLGLVVFGIGLFLANLAAKTIEASGSKRAGLLALAARVAILVLSGAMALREMGWRPMVVYLNATVFNTVLALLVAYIIFGVLFTG